MENKYKTEEFKYLKSLKSDEDVANSYKERKSGKIYCHCTCTTNYASVDEFIRRDFHEVKRKMLNGIMEDSKKSCIADEVIRKYILSVIDMEKIMFGIFSYGKWKYITKTYDMYELEKTTHPNRNITDYLSFKDCIEMGKMEMKRKVLDGIERECAVETYKKSFFVIAKCNCFHDIDSMYEVESYI